MAPRIFAAVLLAFTVQVAWGRATPILLEEAPDDFLFFEGSLEPRLGDFKSSPIIGILTTPWNGTEFDKQSGFLDHYYRWLEQAGARIVPIKYNLPPAELDRIFDSINGLFYTGGGLSLKPTTPYYNTALHLYQRAIAVNKKGDYFPVWGTCMGMQLMSIMAADDYSVLTHGTFKTEGVSLPLEFDPVTLAESKMFRYFPKAVIRMLATRPLTSNLHHDGVTLEDWYSRKQLTDMYSVLSINHDPHTGVGFISTIEARDYPFYAVQWHPERPQFDWSEKENINHGSAAVRAMFAFAEFFVSEARKSTHRYATKEEEEKSLIFNFTPTRSGNNTSLLYLFDD